MSEGGFDQQIPYYREYLEHILKPRVIRAVEEIRSKLTERVWNDLVARMAEEQRAGSSEDPEAVGKLRAMIEQGLRLQLATSLTGSFGAAPVEGTVVQPGAPERPQVEVVDQPQGFPDNPLARAVGGVRRVAR